MCCSGCAVAVVMHYSTASVDFRILAQCTVCEAEKVVEKMNANKLNIKFTKNRGFLQYFIMNFN